MATNNGSILLRARVPEERSRRAAKDIMEGRGLKPGDAVNMLFAQIELRKALPFEVAYKPDTLLKPEQQENAWAEVLGDY